MSPVAAQEGMDGISVSSILSGISDAKVKTEEHFRNVAEALRETKSGELAKKVDDFVYNWFSLLGVYKGISAMATDFVLRYAGRSAFHDNNGPLILAIKRLINHILEGKGAEAITGKFKEFIDAGLKLFGDGALKNCFKDLAELASSNEVTKAFAEKSSGEGGMAFAKALVYLIDPNSVKKAAGTDAKERYGHLDEEVEKSKGEL